MDISTNSNANNNETKQEMLGDLNFVEVKTEIVSEDYLPVKEDKTLCENIIENQFINNFINIKVKKENVDNELDHNISDKTFLEGCSSQIKDEIKEEKFSYEDYNISEIKKEDEFVGTFVAELSKKVNDDEVDEEIIIKEENCVPSDFDENTYTLKEENSDNYRNLLEDDPLKQCKEERKIEGEKAKMKKSKQNKTDQDKYKIHTCTMCPYETTRIRHLNIHISKHTKPEINTNCEFCNKSFNRKRSLDDHILKQHKQEIKGDLKSLITTKVHTCHICNTYETTNKKHMDRHVNLVHTNIQINMKCQFCTKTFKSKQSLDGHVLREHKEQIKNDINSVITSKCHVCNMCNSYETTNKSHLDQHIKTVHNEVRIRMKCQFCTESFIKKSSLDGHVLRKHNDKVNAEIKGFITSKVHACKICSYVSTNKTVFNNHVDSIHNNKVKRKNCQFCNESFTSNYSLDDHLLRKHKSNIESDIKRFITNKILTCNMCSYKTTRLRLLDLHISKHAKEIKNCRFCNKSFNRKRSLDDHLLKQHKQEIKGDLKSLITTKTHTCNICNIYETTNKKHMERHVLLAHSEQKLT